MGFHGTYTRLPGSGSMHQESDAFAVTIHSSHEFTPVNSHLVSGRGKFSPDFIDVIQALLDVSDLRVQARCTVRGTQPLKAAARSARFGPVSLPCEVSIIIYGPRALMGNVGEFFQEVNMYLQDPDGCDSDVRYCNPHRLSSLNINDCPMTSELGRPGTELNQAMFQNIPGESDVLDVFNAHQDLPEAPQPAVIRSLLQK